MSNYTKHVFGRGQFQSTMYNFYYGTFREDILRTIMEMKSEDSRMIMENILEILEVDEELLINISDYDIQIALSGIYVKYSYMRTDFKKLPFLNEIIPNMTEYSLLDICADNELFALISTKINVGLNNPETYEDMFSQVQIRQRIAKISSDLELKHNNNVAPYMHEIFKAFEITRLQDIKVIWLGQDPYHTFTVIDGEEVPSAMGLSFSLRPGDTNINGSLKNMYNLMEDTISFENNNGQIVRFIRPNHGNLTKYAQQGILFLNTALTNCSILRKPHLHRRIWSGFIKNLILPYIVKQCEGIVFVLLGRAAEGSIPAAAANNPKVITSHPSPQSVYRGFSDSDIYNEINVHLNESEKEPINWFDI